MMRRLVTITLMMVTAAGLRAEAPVIRAGDMFNQAGLYYRAYANHYQSLLNVGSYPVANLMKAPGTNLFWDFSQGPTDRTLRFDYLNAQGLPQAADFPLATLAEQKTVEGVGETEWTFFEQVPGDGRKVYGFYSEPFSPTMPSIPFSQPVIDFPDTIAYQATWQTSFTTVSLFPSLDPELVEDFLLQTTWNSTFTADAWGVVKLPGNLGLVDALRINEEQTLDISADLGEGWQHIETDYVRTYYWLSPGKGIVAQMTSLQSTSPPPLNFDLAAAFVRMFETNKQGGPGNTDPEPVSNLRVTVSNGYILVQWSKAANAASYRVEYASGSVEPGSWQSLGTTADDYMFDNSGAGQPARFYRVVSLP